MLCVFLVWNLLTLLNCQAINGLSCWSLSFQSNTILPKNQLVKIVTVTKNFIDLHKIEGDFCLLVGVLCSLSVK